MKALNLLLGIRVLSESYQRLLPVNYIEVINSIRQLSLNNGNPVNKCTPSHIESTDYSAVSSYLEVLESLMGADALAPSLSAGTTGENRSSALRPESDALRQKPSEDGR